MNGGDLFAQLGLPPSGAPTRRGRTTAATDAIERALSGADLFARLGLPCEPVSGSTVRQRYRETALLLQSDRCAWHPQASLALERVQEAFETLKDPNSQSRYLAQLEVEGRSGQIQIKSVPGTEHSQRLPAWDEGWHQYEQRSQQCGGGSSSAGATLMDAGSANGSVDPAATAAEKQQDPRASAAEAAHLDSVLSEGPVAVRNATLVEPLHSGQSPKNLHIPKSNDVMKSTLQPGDASWKYPGNDASRSFPQRRYDPPETSQMPPWKSNATVPATIDADVAGEEPVCLPPLGNDCEDPSGDAICCSTAFSPAKSSAPMRSSDGTSAGTCGLSLSERWASALLKRFHCGEE
eukprot:gnl/MRDRNA2_/MRDRNA2_54476_c0_seq1.p1 gnl/MRDRNA2_/MRDRNA2_54476_c0~~gnl/MRDRNA2_/MRDRNA2_54476_c0_seq1.p1  ORF type:complete len:350 (-),score=65.71 gnl/MRDRNA2_/MRDRNA2_54476_c0_seq1:20-1069(-)